MNSQGTIDGLVNFVIPNFIQLTSNIKELFFLCNILSVFYAENTVDSKFPKPAFQRVQNYIKNHFYLHIVDKKDIEEDCFRKDEESKVSLLEQKANRNHFQEIDEQYKLIDFEEDTGSYSLLESIIIISAYIASRNPETSDHEKFGSLNDPNQKRKRMNAGGSNTARNKIGKTKRFTMDRLLAIVDFFLNLKAGYSFETQNLNHSSSVYAKINTLAWDKILKWSQGKNDDPASTVFWVNFDEAFAL